MHGVRPAVRRNTLRQDTGNRDTFESGYIECTLRSRQTIFDAARGARILRACVISDQRAFVFILKGHTLLHEMPAFASAAAGRYVSTSV